MTGDIDPQNSEMLSRMSNSNVVLTPMAIISDGDNYSTQDAILLVESMLNENHTTKNSTYYNVLHSTTTIEGFTNSSSHTGTETQSLYDQASNFVSSLISEVSPIAIDVSVSDDDDGTVQIDVIFPDEPYCPICPVAEVPVFNCDSDFAGLYNTMYSEMKDACPVSIFKEHSYFVNHFSEGLNKIRKQLAYTFFSNFPKYPDPNLLNFNGEEIIEIDFLFAENGIKKWAYEIGSDEVNKLYCDIFEHIEGSKPSPNHILIGIEIIKSAWTNVYWKLKLTYGLPVVCDCPQCEICC